MDDEDDARPEFDRWAPAGVAYMVIGDELARQLACDPAEGRRHAADLLMARLRVGAITAKADLLRIRSDRGCRASLVRSQGQQEARSVVWRQIRDLRARAAARGRPCDRSDNLLAGDAGGGDQLSPRQLGYRRFFLGCRHCWRRRLERQVRPVRPSLRGCRARFHGASRASRANRRAGTAEGRAAPARRLAVILRRAGGLRAGAPGGGGRGPRPGSPSCPGAAERGRNG